MHYPGLGKPDQSKKSRANNHEKVLAKKLKAKRQPNSGALPAHKGDIKTCSVLFDSKETIDKKITITAEMLAKISMEARQINRQPGLIISLEVGLTVEKEWAIIQLDYYGTLVEELQGLRKQIKELKHVAKYAGEDEASQ